MEPAELDREIEELETRVERLRALYEQYFLGIEKIEPLVPKKDVDRRIWRLRREQIRNTGKRFRLQTIIQRYNTFQQYWMRICREIEAGTYTRHLNRAKKIMADAEPLTIAARKRKRAHQRALERLADEEAASRERAEAATKELEDLSDLLDQPGALDSAMASVDQLLSAPEPAPASSSVRPRMPSRRPSRRGGRLSELDLDLNEVEGKLLPSVAPSRESPPETPQPSPAPPGRPASTRQGPAPPPTAPAQPGPRPTRGGRPPAGLRAGVPPVGPQPAARSAPGAPPRSPAPAAPSGPRAGQAPSPLPGPLPRSPGARPPAAPPPHRPTGTGIAPGRRGPMPTRTGPTPRPVTPPRASKPKDVAATSPPHPFAPPRSGGQKSEGLSEKRVRELHSKLTAAKEQTNDKSSVSVESLRKSLQSAEARLRSKHGAHRKIEFDVVIKDGKAVVKPVVK